MKTAKRVLIGIGLWTAASFAYVGTRPTPPVEAQEVQQTVKGIPGQSVRYNNETEQFTVKGDCVWQTEKRLKCVVTYDYK